MPSRGAGKAHAAIWACRRCHVAPELEPAVILHRANIIAGNVQTAIVWTTGRHRSPSLDRKKLDLVLEPAKGISCDLQVNHMEAAVLFQDQLMESQDRRHDHRRCAAAYSMRSSRTESALWPAVKQGKAIKAIQPQATTCCSI